MFVIFHSKLLYIFMWLWTVHNGTMENVHCYFKFLQESRKAIATALESNKEENAKVIAKKDSSLEELNKIKDQQADKLVQIQATAQEFQTSLTVEIQRWEMNRGTILSPVW